MYFGRTALAAACFILWVNGEDNNDSQQKKDPEDNESVEADEDGLSDNHTFVALIDIVFTDNNKRTCTGAIIHENIVITAAHCFLGSNKLISSKPELTASFVVIGTKRMFDTGYEQYLPIERIVVHPKYEGWTADLALVFTFAGMTSDKPGTIIPLGGEKSTAHMDSNVTVFSWGHTRTKHVASSLENESSQKKYLKKYNKKEQTASDESCSSDVENKLSSRMNNKRKAKQNTAGIMGQRFRNEQTVYTSSYSLRVSKKKRSQKYRQFKARDVRERAHGEERAQGDGNIEKEITDEEKRTTSISRYLTIVESAEKVESSINPYVFGGNESYDSFEKLLKTGKPNRKKTTISTEITNVSTKQKHREKDAKAKKTYKERKKNKRPPMLYSFKSSNSWRRSMGTQQNRLLVETFGFVNLQTCRTLVSKALPAEYNISKHNDVICYTNSERCVNENDSGAPVVRQKQLVAITVGGAECEGDHVAVGMKIACYCSWISDNLPPGSTRFSCCKNCCDVSHKEDNKKPKRHKFRNKFI